MGDGPMHMDLSERPEAVRGATKARRNQGQSDGESWTLISIRTPRVCHWSPK